MTIKTNPCLDFVSSPLFSISVEEKKLRLAAFKVEPEKAFFASDGKKALMSIYFSHNLHLLSTLLLL